MSEWKITEETGYEPTTDLWDRFSKAEEYGRFEIERTYRAAIDEYQTDHVALTELVLVLNWKIWETYNKQSLTLCDIYDSLWKKADAYCFEHFTKSELDYFLETTD